MEGFVRYAIYYAPPEDHPLTAFGARWLGWDAEAGRTVAHPPVDLRVAEITARPRKYGFHGTLKPPFRLAEGASVADLHAGLEALSARLPAPRVDALVPARLGAFLALRPEGETGALAELAMTLVEAFDGFRAPPSDEEIARRTANPLSPRQMALLAQWGYPYVADEFRFHMTLSGPLEPDEAEAALAVLAPLVSPFLDRPWAFREVCLFGETVDGQFRNLHRYPLTG